MLTVKDVQEMRARRLERGACGTCHYAKWATSPAERAALAGVVAPLVACLRFPPVLNPEGRTINAPRWLAPMMPVTGWCGEYTEAAEGAPLPWDWREQKGGA